MLSFLINNLDGGGNMFRSERGIPFGIFVFFNQLLIISTVILCTLSLFAFVCLKTRALHICLTVKKTRGNLTSCLTSLN